MGHCFVCCRAFRVASLSSQIIEPVCLEMGVLMIRRVLMSVLVTVMAFAAVISGAALLVDRDAVAVFAPPERAYAPVSLTVANADPKIIAEVSAEA